MFPAVSRRCSLPRHDFLPGAGDGPLHPDDTNDAGALEREDIWQLSPSDRTDIPHPHPEPPSGEPDAIDGRCFGATAARVPSVPRQRTPARLLAARRHFASNMALTLLLKFSVKNARCLVLWCSSKRSEEHTSELQSLR